MDLSVCLQRQRFQDRMNGLLRRFRRQLQNCGRSRRRIRQEAKRRHRTNNSCRTDRPPGRLFEGQHRPDPLPDAHFPESQRADKDRFPPLTAGDQRLRVGFSPGKIHFLHCLFIAGKLQIPVKANIRRPDKRMEPVDRQQQIRRQLPDRVAPLQMGSLMSEDQLRLLLAQSPGQIDLRPEQPENEGCPHAVAKKDPVPHGNRLLKSPL